MSELNEGIEFISDKVIVKLFLCIALALFLFNETTRTMLYDSNLNYYVNILYFFFGLIAIVAICFNRSMDIWNTLLVLAFFIGASIMLLSIRSSINQYIILIISMLIPFLVIGFRLPIALFQTFFAKFIRYLNIYVIFLLTVGTIDYLSGASIQTFFAEHHIFSSSFSELVMIERASGIYRYYSFFGHPLVNAWYVLVFYTLNILNNRYFKPVLNENVVITITILGLVLCGSRTALILGVFLCIFMNNRKSKGRFLWFFSLLSTVIVMTPLFQQNIFRRFMIGKITGDHSEGRNEIIYKLINGFAKPPDLFAGGGPGYSRHVAQAIVGKINSFEYPFIMFAYDFGIIGAILIYIIILILPSLIFIKNGTYFILFIFWGLVLYLNGFNSLANYTDFMGQFCFIAMILLNMSYVIAKKREEGLKI